MAVTKLPRTRKGTLSQGPPLSWPNDTTIGPRRPRFGLLQHATHHSQQHRISKLAASSRHKAPKPKHHPPLRSQAPRASGYLRHKAHKRTHHPKQHSRAPKPSGKPSNQDEKLVTREPTPHPTQLSEDSQISTNSPTRKNDHARPPKNDPTHPSPPPPPPIPINWPAYTRAKAQRLKAIRIWIHSLRQSHRIVAPVATELMAYYGSEKYGAHPSARTLSKHAWEAVRLCEREFGTDLMWGRGLGVGVWGSECGKVERLIGIMMEGEGEGEVGVGTVGESDLSEFEDEGGDDDDDDEGFWGGGEEGDVEMADAA